MSTIYILWLRQIKKYSRSRIIGALGQPLLFLLALGFGFGSIYQQAGRGDYIQFLAPGVIMMSVLFTAIFSGTELIWDRQFGFLKETMVAPVPRIAIMLGKTLGGATVAVFQGMIVFVLAILIGFRPHHLLMIPLAGVFVVLVALLFTSLGIAMASKMEDFQGFQLIMNFLVMPVFFLSGALFPLQGLPRALKMLTRLDPLTYGIDGMRAALIGGGTFGIPADFSILAVLTLVLMGIGSYLFGKIEA